MSIKETMKYIDDHKDEYLAKKHEFVHWSDKYPHELHANVLLLDGKIENWKVGNMKADSKHYPFSSYWKVNRMKLVTEGDHQFYELGDYEVKSFTWTVNNYKEHNDVFNYHASEWFKQWEHADDYRLGKAY
ncbi:hypothetical protein G7L40_20650 [Paenibacillus polymyxa]|uniref:Uncharacterized protein n=2 Tax=Paenibacillus polymyxa TaxID=1406 RepID=A0A378XZ09_PAEPO|nr:hypothetical protein [Paenibacillus polymyxa]MBE7896096.1 hypothetical protein [Paenibacillus polymyxa]MBG9765956.1 hypothetical protein [Paenibacillus polymyxa]MCC3256630.1 hypothetical protein [Paenibacillus polymyxa]QPK54882.1 hypothetical protein G7035_20705 [Paenibacillus polymyxa]QPK59970.1 hypothetical protein G7L40_20650 [Paenibacillus polymyxa]